MFRSDWFLRPERYLREEVVTASGAKSPTDEAACVQSLLVEAKFIDNGIREFCREDADALADVRIHRE